MLEIIHETKMQFKLPSLNSIQKQGKMPSATLFICPSSKIFLHFFFVKIPCAYSQKNFVQNFP